MPARFLQAVPVLLLLLFAGCGQQEGAPGAVEEGTYTVAVNNENFAEVVEGSEGLAIVDFWAPWCGPCKVIGPYLENMSRDYGEELQVFKVNTDHNPELAERFQIRGIPTLVLYKDGKSIDMRVGAAPEKELRAWVEEHLDQSQKS